MGGKSLVTTASARSPVGETSKTLAASDPRHGTNNGYNNYGCRCEPCVKAGRAYQAARRRAQGTPTRQEVNESRKQHGWSRYKNGGCRCDVCRAAAAAQKRRQRANNAEHYREYWREHGRSRAA